MTQPGLVRRSKPVVASANGGAEASASDVPWSSPADVSKLLGFTGLVFSHPGAGKTTMLKSMTHAEGGSPLLIVNFDPDVDSLRDLTGPEVQTWPGVKAGGKIKDWPQIATFLRRLANGKHPFGSIAFDSLNGLYGYAITYIKATTNYRDPRQTFGEANDLVNAVLREWSLIAREQKKLIMFTCHDSEKQDGDNGPIFIRPDVTPGVIKVAYQALSAVAYLEVRPSGTRKLTLRNKLNVVAKVHQPQSGEQLALEIENPDLGRIIDHLRGIRTYPAAKKAKMQ